MPISEPIRHLYTYTQRMTTSTTHNTSKPHKKHHTSPDTPATNHPDTPPTSTQPKHASTPAPAARWPSVSRSCGSSRSWSLRSAQIPTLFRGRRRRGLMLGISLGLDARRGVRGWRGHRGSGFIGYVSWDEWVLVLEEVTNRFEIVFDVFEVDTAGNASEEDFARSPH